MQAKFIEDRKRNGDTVIPFNRSYNFLEILARLNLIQEGTSRNAKDALSWRDIHSYE
jgi:hypothetical protein